MEGVPLSDLLSVRNLHDSVRAIQVAYERTNVQDVTDKETGTKSSNTTALYSLIAEARLATKESFTKQHIFTLQGQTTSVNVRLISI